MSEPAETVVTTEMRLQALMDFLNHHVLNAREWHIVPGLTLHIEWSWFSLHAIMLVLAAGFLIYLFGFRYDRHQKVPSGLSNLLETFVLFIRDKICIACLGEEDGKRMAPLFLSFFFFILTLNLMGLIPFFASATANVSVTGGLAAISLFFMTFGAIYKNGFVGFFQAFVPHGVPWPVLILLVPIEMLGVLIKCFALMIRLFANMLAGHMVLGAIIGLIVVFGLIALPAAALGVAVYILKIGVSLLQAYIFTMLSAMFMGQIWHPAH